MLEPQVCLYALFQSIVLEQSKKSKESFLEKKLRHFFGSDPTYIFMPGKLVGILFRASTGLKSMTGLVALAPWFAQAWVGVMPRLKASGKVHIVLECFKTLVHY